MHYAVLAERAGWFKHSAEGSDTMCRAVEELWEEGRKIGEEKSSRRSAQRMLAAGKLALEEIAEYSGLPLDEVKRLRDNLPTSTKNFPTPGTFLLEKAS